MRFFGYFLSVQKVTRGTGAKLPKSFGKKHVSPPPARRWANLGPSVPFAGTGEAKRGVGPKAPWSKSLQKIKNHLFHLLPVGDAVKPGGLPLQSRQAAGGGHAGDLLKLGDAVHAVADGLLDRKSVV